MSNHILYRAFDSETEEFGLIDEARRGKIYVDLPHRYFDDLEGMKTYVKQVSEMGANVLLILPHFLPSFSEYVVKSYEKPCALFGSWKAFGEFMKYVESLGMDRMIDIPFNHADWQAENLQREWYQNHWENGIEAGADDTDADGNRVRINWGAFTLDNGNPDLLRYWLEKVIFPHAAKYHVSSIRIDAAWGLDRQGLATIVRETKAKYPKIWFLAENLGMQPLIKLAESGLEAGAERYFNNFYWYTGGRYIPSDMYCLTKRSGGKPTCTLYSSHDVLMPAMRALSWLRVQELGTLNDKALHRKVVEWERINNLAQLPMEQRDDVIRLMKLDFMLAAFLSTDLMWVAGSERCLLERVDVLRSGSVQFFRGINSDLPAFMTAMLRAKASDEIFNTEGTVIPLGEWGRGTTGVRGYVRKVGDRLCLVAVNIDLEASHECPLPKRLKASKNVNEITTLGWAKGLGTMLPPELVLAPGQGVILFTP